jgi:hypothetical protein
MFRAGCLTLETPWENTISMDISLHPEKILHRYSLEHVYTLL